MAETIVHTDISGGIKETFAVDGDTVIVRRQQDSQPIIDAVAKANSHGTTEIPGLGRLLAEIPTALLIDYCERRGIPWEDMAYRGHYADEFGRFIKDHPKLVYEYRRKYGIAA